MPRVYISPSTQDHNVGVGNYGTEEQRMNLIADVVVQLLQYNHMEVYRNSPSMTLQEAVADSNNRNVEAHFAIHSNAGGGAARGGEVFYVSTNGHKLADAVYKYLEPLTPTADRGVKLNEHLYELNQTKAVAALAEVMFHDNIDDANFIMSHIQELGEAIVKGICEYFRVEFKKPQPKATENLAQFGIVTASLLNVRSGSGTNFSVIGTLKKGEKVKIDKAAGDWYSIYFGSHGGYVHKNYIKLV